MSETNPDKSQRSAWIITIAAALALYVLSIGPVAGLLHNGTIPKSAEKPLSVIYAPLLLLKTTEPGDAYLKWWVKALRQP